MEYGQVIDESGNAINNFAGHVNGETQYLGEANSVSGVSEIEYQFTNTAAKHLAEFIKRRSNAGLLSRPYMRSSLAIREIMATGNGIPDADFPGGLNWRAPGFLRGSAGVWELGINSETNLIYHFNFTAP